MLKALLESPAFCDLYPVMWACFWPASPVVGLDDVTLRRGANKAMSPSQVSSGPSPRPHVGQRGNPEALPHSGHLRNHGWHLCPRPTRRHHPHGPPPTAQRRNPPADEMQGLPPGPISLAGALLPKPSVPGLPQDRLQTRREPHHRQVGRGARFPLRWHAHWGRQLHLCSPAVQD